MGIDKSIVAKDNACTEAAVKGCIRFLRVVFECAVFYIYSFLRAECKRTAPGTVAMFFAGIVSVGNKYGLPIFLFIKDTMVNQTNARNP